MKGKMQSSPKLQQKIRETLNKYIDDNGIKAKWLSGQTNVNESSLCHFRGGRNLTDVNLYKLKIYLQSKNYL